jgi:nitroreductase
MSANTISRFTQEELLAMDPDLLAALLRGMGHQVVEYPLHQAIALRKPLPSHFGRQFQRLLDIWEARQLPGDRDDIRWCYQILNLSEQYSLGKQLEIDSSPAVFSQVDQETIGRLIRTRRSIRCWTEEQVPEFLIEKVMQAGLWAPHSCNLQTIRYMVLKNEAIKDLFQVRRLRGNRVCILIAQDLRPYDCFGPLIPAENQNFECGAAVQNMLLSAHSFGLGAVWLTFEKGEAQFLQEKYRLPKYITLKTYIAVGWPAQFRLPPGRKSVQDALLP